MVIRLESRFQSPAERFIEHNIERAGNLKHTLTHPFVELGKDCKKLISGQKVPVAFFEKPNVKLKNVDNLLATPKESSSEIEPEGVQGLKGHLDNAFDVSFNAMYEPIAFPMNVFKALVNSQGTDLHSFETAVNRYCGKKKKTLDKAALGVMKKNDWNANSPEAAKFLERKKEMHGELDKRQQSLIDGCCSPNALTYEEMDINNKGKKKEFDTLCKEYQKEIKGFLTHEKGISCTQQQICDTEKIKNQKQQLTIITTKNNS